MKTPAIHRHGSWDKITPKVAGWTYVSFRVETLQAGESVQLEASDLEHALVPLAGMARVEANGFTWNLGGRASVFDAVGSCLYLPRGLAATITADSTLEIAIAGAPATQDFQPTLVTADAVSVELRGGGNASRQVAGLMLPDFPADRLHVIEVWTPGGNWSSYPPHKHEVTREGEAQLEETYYYRLRDPKNGWALQRVYSPERNFELTEPVRDGDILTIPWGYHTTVASHGHDLYYLNILAGPASRRTLQASEDPYLARLKEDWPAAGIDARLPLVPKWPTTDTTK